MTQQRFGERGRGAYEVLAIVQHEQHGPKAEVIRRIDARSGPFDERPRSPLADLLGMPYTRSLHHSCSQKLRPWLLTLHSVKWV